MGYIAFFRKRKKKDITDIPAPFLTAGHSQAAKAHFLYLFGGA